MNTSLKSALFLVAAVFNVTALAHTDEMLDDAKSAHGGQTRMAGPYHLEIVVNDKNVDLYVTDHAGNPKDGSKAKASATVLDGKALKKLEFAFVAANQLRANQAVSHDEKVQIVVQFQLVGEAIQQAKFTPFKKTVKPHEHGTDQSHDHSHQEADHQHQG